MSVPTFIYSTLTGLLAGISEPERTGKYVAATCPNFECEWREHTRPLDYWNSGRTQPNGKPILLRSYLRCGRCHNRLVRYRLTESADWREV